jgi:hypothetical protein
MTGCIPIPADPTPGNYPGLTVVAAVAGLGAAVGRPGAQQLQCVVPIKDRGSAGAGHAMAGRQRRRVAAPPQMVKHLGEWSLNSD